MYKILLVDDEKAITEGIRHVIQGFNMGFDQIIISTSAKEALRIIDEFKPDIIITDIMMIDMDGLALCQEIRGRDDELSLIPLIIISGYNEFDYAKKAIGCNVLGYLTKPINKQELHDVLKKAVFDIEKVKNNAENEPQQRSNDLFYKTISSTSRNSLFDEAGVFLPENSSLNKKNNFILIGIPGLQNRMKESLLENRIIEKLKKSINSENDRSMPVCWCIYQSFFLILIRSSSNPAAENESIPADVLRRFAASEQILIFASSFFSDAMGIHRSLEQIFLISKYSKFIIHDNVIGFSEIENRKEKGTLELKEIRKIIKAVSEKDTMMLIKQLDGLEKFIKGNDLLDIDYIIGIYQNLFNEIYNQFYDSGFFQKHPQIAQNLLSFDETLDQDLFTNSIYLTIKSQMLELLRSYRTFVDSDQINDNIIRIKDFIDLNYTDPNLSLQMISEKFDLNASYLSSLFKKETGVNFNDYLVRKRINHSIHLLSDTDLPISEISRKVGYISDKHFFVVFKNQQGVSPAKYRKQR